MPGRTAGRRRRRPSAPSRPRRDRPPRRRAAAGPDRQARRRPASGSSRSARATGRSACAAGDRAAGRPRPSGRSPQRAGTSRLGPRQPDAAVAHARAGRATGRDGRDGRGTAPTPPPVPSATLARGRHLPAPARRSAPAPGSAPATGSASSTCSACPRRSSRPVDGIVGATLVEAGDAVEYGQELDRHRAGHGRRRRGRLTVFRKILIANRGEIALRDPAGLPDARHRGGRRLQRGGPRQPAGPARRRGDLHRAGRRASARTSRRRR